MESESVVFQGVISSLKVSSLVPAQIRANTVKSRLNSELECSLVLPSVSKAEIIQYQQKDPDISRVLYFFIRNQFPTKRQMFNESKAVRRLSSKWKQFYVAVWL